MLNQSVRKHADIDHLQYWLDGHVKTDGDCLILFEEHYHEIYGCNPHNNDNENEKTNQEDDENELTNLVPNFITQTVAIGENW